MGSLYALELAQILVPALKSQGYVFSAPILQFSPLAERLISTEQPQAPALILDSSIRDRRKATCPSVRRGPAGTALYSRIAECTQRYDPYSIQHFWRGSHR